MWLLLRLPLLDPACTALPLSPLSRYGFT